MRDLRISVVPIDAQDGEYTVGILFLNDLINLLRRPNFYKLLSLSVINFIKEINYYDADDDPKPEIKAALSTQTPDESSSSHRNKGINSNDIYSSESDEDEINKFGAVQDKPFFGLGAFGLQTP